MSSKKTVIKETPNLPASSQLRTKRKTEYLNECINTILRRELLHLNVKKVFDILTNDLKINLKNVSTRMKYVLSECLCFYMKMWPGWKQYEAVCTNERSKMEYIEKFKEYLVFKINYIMENEKLFNPEILNKERPVMVTQEVQTDPIGKKNKPEAPYNLVISGQPNVLNNIVFIEMDNHIVIKQHAEKAWKPLNVAEFLNYSFVYVVIKLPDLELSRSNLHEFQRYITECGDPAACPDVDFIEYIRKVNTKINSKVYSKDFIHAYFKQFLDVIKKIQGINAVKITELEEVFRQFILDIEESNVFSSTNAAGQVVNTMATNTTVCFNIGEKTYIRNKKMVVNSDNQKEANAINFCEVLIPRLAYTLTKFFAEEDVSTEDTSFKSLNDIQARIGKREEELFKFIETVNSSVEYHCLLCPKVYIGDRAYIDILDHYRFLHKGEQSVLCFTCRKQFAISKLAGSRWSHECSTSQKSDISVITKTKGENVAPGAERAAIGISDILESAASTLSIDDLKRKQTVVVNSLVSGVNKTVNNSPASNSVINTLPLVQVSTNSTPPNLLVTFTSGLNVSSTVIPSNTITVLNSNPLTIISNPLTVPQNPVAAVSMNTSSDANANQTPVAIKHDIKLEVNSECGTTNIATPSTIHQIVYPTLNNTALVTSPSITRQNTSPAIRPLLLAGSNTIMSADSRGDFGGVVPLVAIPVIPAPTISTVATSVVSTNN